MSAARVENAGASGGSIYGKSEDEVEARSAESSLSQGAAPRTGSSLFTIIGSPACTAGTSLKDDA